MKKIMTALLCALGFSLVTQAERINGTNFESLEIGTNVLGQTIVEDGNHYWYASAVDVVDAIVTNYVGEYEGDYPSIHTNSETNAKMLYINTKGEELIRSNSTQNVEIGNGIYFDSMVQFTATDTLTATNDEDKLIIWLRESVESVDENTKVTNVNLVVTAGYLNGQYVVETKDYVVLNPVQADKWYRLTIQAITNAIHVGESKNYVGYAIFIDGVKAEYSTDIAAFDNARKYEVSSPYDNYLYKENKHALYPSLMNWDATGGDTFKAVAFSGVGAVDDIEFNRYNRADAPEFLRPPASLTVEWRENIATVTVSNVNNNATFEINAAGIAGSTNFEAGVYTVAATAVDGYMMPTISDSAPDASASMVTVTIETSPVVATVDGVAYASLTNAIDAAGAVATGDAVVSLRGDVNLGDEGLTIDGAYAFVLDLNGKIITSDQTSGEVLTVQSELTVIDSVGGGAISNLVADTLVYLNGGFLTVGYVNGDNGATFYGQIGREAEETISIVRGKFSSAPEAGYIADGSYQKEEPEDNLYVVEPGTPVNNVAEVNGQGYETLADAVAAAGSSDTVTLLADITLDDWILVEKAFALDLNGHTLSKGENWTTVTPAHDAIVAIKHGGSLTINDTVGTGVIDGTDLAVGVKMTVAYDTDDTYPAVLVVNAGTIKGENYGISGNGLPGRGNTAVTINGGTILGVDPTGDSCGIFNPQAGTLTIAGGHIEGGQGIWIKSGTCTCTVNAGTIVGTAPKAAYKTSTNGFNSTGDAFVVDNVGYVGGAPVPSIAGGTFVSSNSTAVASYADSKNSPIESFVSGGTFNTAVETEYCATGFIPADNGNGTYGVEAGWKIAFVNDDDTLIYATNVQANATVEYLGETPTKAADAEYTYEFTGWTPAIVSPAVADATYTATFSATPIAPAAPVVDGNPVDTDKVFEEAASNKPIVYPTAPTVTTDSETGSQTITYGGQTVDVPAYYTATLEGTTVTLELNEKAVPAIEEATISEETKPAMEVTGSTTAVTLGTTSTKLYYGLVSADAPDSDDLNPASAGFTVPTLTQGTGNAMQISIPVDSNETSKFYKVYVTDIAPASGN